MIGGRHGWSVWMACLVLAVGLGFAVPAAAGQVVTGSGLIVEKDVARGLLTLNTGVVLVVTVRTKIASERGKRITLAELAVAPVVKGGLLQASGDAMVRYKGNSSAGRVSAYSIQVLGAIPH